MNYAYTFYLFSDFLALWLILLSNVDCYNVLFLRQIIKMNEKFVFLLANGQQTKKKKNLPKVYVLQVEIFFFFSSDAFYTKIQNFLQTCPVYFLKYMWWISNKYIIVLVLNGADFRDFTWKYEMSSLAPGASHQNVKGRSQSHQDDGAQWRGSLSVVLRENPQNHKV